jgi:hypothetical protein
VSGQTTLQKLEAQALVGETQATIECVSAIREFRAAAKALLALRYRDGECDAVTLTVFADALERIEARER